MEPANFDKCAEVRNNCKHCNNAAHMVFYEDHAQMLCFNLITTNLNFWITVIDKTFGSMGRLDVYRHELAIDKLSETIATQLSDEKRSIEK